MTVEMHKGQRYKILFRRQPSTAPLVAILDFLSENDNNYIMSGRPIMGTQQIPKVWVLDIEEASPSAECRINSQMREE